jgi:hypothetical protein
MDQPTQELHLGRPGLSTFSGRLPFMLRSRHPAGVLMDCRSASEKQ